MALSVNCLLGKHKGLSSNLQHTRKSQECVIHNASLGQLGEWTGGGSLTLIGHPT